MKIKESERQYAYWLCCVPGIGNRTIQMLLQSCGSPEEIYRGGENLWGQFLTVRQREAMVQARAVAEPEKGYAQLQEKGIQFVLQGDAGYPERLETIPDAPFALFVKGRLPEEHVLSVAVIGARDCSEYGRFVASELGGALGRCGVQVISGMARGIDGISQQAALEAGGRSFGVLGSGVDVCYPRGNRDIYDKLCEQGGVLSIYPPGTEARPQNFPPRNRIVSGLADVLVVIEARSKSGTLITVDMALEQGREVFAVPGRVTDRLSDGCNNLLKQGAGVFLSPEDFLEEIGNRRYHKGNDGAGIGESERDWVKEPKVLDITTPLRVKQLDQELREVYFLLDMEPRSTEEILVKMGENSDAARLTVLLMRLCMENLAVQVTPGRFARRV